MGLDPSYQTGRVWQEMRRQGGFYCLSLLARQPGSRSRWGLQGLGHPVSDLALLKVTTPLSNQTDLRETRTHLEVDPVRRD
jgi:hypothetical protein